MKPFRIFQPHLRCKLIATWVTPANTIWNRRTTRKKESEVAQSCLTPCDPMDCSLPGSSLHGIFQARTLKWGAISYSRGGLPDPGVEPMSLVSPAWAGRFFTTSPTWEADLYHKTFIHALDAVDWEGRNIQVWIYSLSNCIILGNIFSFSLGSSSYNGDQISVIDDSGDDCVRECL